MHSIKKAFSIPRFRYRFCRECAAGSSRLWLSKSVRAKTDLSLTMQLASKIFRTGPNGPSGSSVNRVYWSCALQLATLTTNRPSAVARNCVTREIETKFNVRLMSRYNKLTDGQRAGHRRFRRFERGLFLR